MSFLAAYQLTPVEKHHASNRRKARKANPMWFR